LRAIQPNEVVAELWARNYSRAFYHVPLPHMPVIHHLPHYPPLPHIPVIHHLPHYPPVEEKSRAMLFMILGLGAALLLSEEENQEGEEGESEPSI